MTTRTLTMDQQEQIARIERMQEEIRKFVTQMNEARPIRSAAFQHRNDGQVRPLSARQCATMKALWA